MITPKTTVFCKNIGSYEGQLTKRKAYFVQEINGDNLRIKNDHDKLKWYSMHYFDWEKEPDITSIQIDDKIENRTCDLVEVTIEFSNKQRYWTTFTTPEYLKKLLMTNDYVSIHKWIVIGELTEVTIKEIVSKLDQHNELIPYCNKY